MIETAEMCSGSFPKYIKLFYVQKLHNPKFMKIYP